MSQSDRTANGVSIVVGLRVLTNDLKVGTVTKLNADGWHNVETDEPGYSGIFNGERLTTRNPFTGEEIVTDWDALAQEVAFYHEHGQRHATEGGVWTCDTCGKVNTAGFTCDHHEDESR